MAAVKAHYSCWIFFLAEESHSGQTTCYACYTRSFKVISTNSGVSLPLIGCTCIALWVEHTLALVAKLRVPFWLPRVLSCKHFRISKLCWLQLMNHDTPGKAHVTGSYGTSVRTILFKELLGHGLATHNERASVLLGTVNALLGSLPSQIAKATQCSSALLELLDCRPCYLHIFEAVATRIFETWCDGSSQVWSQLHGAWTARQSTCHGLLWLLWRICGCIL